MRFTKLEVCIKKEGTRILRGIHLFHYSRFNVQLRIIVMCGNELSGSIKCGEFLTSCKPVSFSRRTLLHGVSK
jgi:hypothetical protein